MIAVTRLSTIAVSQVVQPRFEPPATVKLVTEMLPPCAVAQNALTVSIARIADLAIGSCVGQRVSLVRKYLSQLYAMIASSLLELLSSVKVSGSLGTILISAMTVCVSRASWRKFESARVGTLPPLLPPLM